MLIEFDDRLAHRFVLIAGALFGLSLVFVTPPFSAPDEFPHLLRAYHCSQGKLYAVKLDNQAGDDMPASFERTYAAITHFAAKDEEFRIDRSRLEVAAKIPLDPEHVKFIGFANTALYSPVPYAPQALVLGIARLFVMRPLYMIYAARLANLIAYLALVATAIRIAPVQKWTLALVALIPMSVYLAAALSADGVTIALALLVVAMAMDLAVRNGPVDRRSLCLLGVLLVLLGLSKQAYLGLVLLAFVIPGDKFESARSRCLSMGLIIGMPLLIDAVWLYSLRTIYVPIRAFVDPSAQAHWIVTHPWAYASSVANTMCDTERYSYTVGAFGWLGAKLHKWTRDCYWIGLGITALLDGGGRRRFDLRTRLVVVGTYVATAAFMETLVFLSCEPVGFHGIIEGLQPRYWLPIIPLLLLSIRGWEKLTDSRLAPICVPIVAVTAVLIGASSTWWTLYRRYYSQW